jgi:hypothetical protein
MYRSLTEASQSSFRAIKSRSRFVVKSLKLKCIFAHLSADSSRIEDDETSGSNGHMNMNQRRGRRRRSMWRHEQLPLPIRFISSLFYGLQLFSATTCVVLSAMRLASQDFGPTEEADKANRNFALNVFYVLALTEALVFLAEKAYWEWKVGHCGLLQKVNAKYRLGPSGMISIKRFFYDAYSKCVTGSIFDGLKMDLVTFAQELLLSSSGDEQLMGAQILLALSTHQHQRLSDAAIRKIRTSVVVTERLIEMLNWKNCSAQEVRYSAAAIISKLADDEQNVVRIAGIPGAMESISSLLYVDPTIQGQGRKYDSLAFNLLGLLILEKLARHYDGCVKMGHIQGLLHRIIDFMSIREGVNSEAVKKSLQVVKLLISSTGHTDTGAVFRREISVIAVTVSNIRDILFLRRPGEHQWFLIQSLALEIIGKLAVDVEARERIGSTDGMVKELLALLLFHLPAAKRPTAREQYDDYYVYKLRMAAGEALAMLAVESKANCGRILEQERSVERLTEALDDPDPVFHVSCSRILQKLCAFTGPEWCREMSRVISGFRRVLKGGIMDAGIGMHVDVVVLEASLGLAVQMVRLMSSERLNDELHRACLSEADLVRRLAGILQLQLLEEAPQIRRFAGDLAVELTRIDQKYVKMLKEAGINSMAIEGARRSSSTITERIQCSSSATCEFTSPYHIYAYTFPV